MNKKKNQSSFDNIRAWLSEIKQYAEDDVVIMLLGNKVDKANRVISKEQGEKLAKVNRISSSGISLVCYILLIILNSNMKCHLWRQVLKLVKMSSFLLWQLLGK